MKHLVDDIKQSLNEIAKGLFAEGQKEATKMLNDAFERLATNYANSNGLAVGKYVGKVWEPAISSQHRYSDKRLLVFRKKERYMINMTSRAGSCSIIAGSPITTARLLKICREA